MKAFRIVGRAKSALRCTSSIKAPCLECRPTKRIQCKLCVSVADISELHRAQDGAIQRLKQTPTRNTVSSTVMPTWGIGKWESQPFASGTLAARRAARFASVEQDASSEAAVLSHLNITPK